MTGEKKKTKQKEVSDNLENPNEMPPPQSPVDEEATVSADALAQGDAMPDEKTCLKAGELKKLLEKAEQAHSLQEKYLRAQADFDNFRKRAQKEKEEAIKYASESLLLHLLPVLDSFDMGMQQVETSSDMKAIQQGMKMIHQQFKSLLQELGIEIVDATGQKFDHNLHDAMSTQETLDHEDGIIIAQTRKGYRLKGRLLRPASVIVAKSPESSVDAING